MLAEEWDEEVKALKSGSGEDRGGEGYPKYKGHVVKKKALIRALKMPTKNPALTDEFVKTLLHLINSSPVQEITSTMKSDEEYHLHEGSSLHDHAARGSGKAMAVHLDQVRGSGQQG